MWKINIYVEYVFMTKIFGTNRTSVWFQATQSAINTIATIDREQAQHEIWFTTTRLRLSRGDCSPKSPRLRRTSLIEMTLCPMQKCFDVYIWLHIYNILTNIAPQKWLKNIKYLSYDIYSWNYYFMKIWKTSRWIIIIFLIVFFLNCPLEASGEKAYY